MDLQEAKEKCDELRDAKQEAVRELLQLQDQHQEELRAMRSDLQEESQSHENLDRRINELRAEVCEIPFLTLFLIPLDKVVLNSCF